MKKLPVGTQSFEKLRKDGAIYIDKTEYIYNLINNGSVYFLSRPRRFGKSLLINTFKELFKCNKEIFEGLYIYDKWDWSKKYPVIHLDFAELAYNTPKRLENSLSDFINNTASDYSITLTNSEIETRFSELIKKLRETTNQNVVLLIDEYDKPMIDSLNKAKEIHQEIKETLHNFYQVIKGSDEHIKFMFMTGVSRFAGLSVFSALNNLYDITMDSEFSSICGYTQEELGSNFKEYVELTAKNLNLTYQETISEIKKWYNGYSWEGKTYVYNPFSTLSFFRKKKFENYWFETGTPTFLIEQIKKKNDLESFVQSREVGMDSLKGDGSDNIETTALLFQTGYLTIKKEEIGEDRRACYTLDFPNMEVRNAFLSSLMKAYALRDLEEINEISKKIAKGLKEKDGESLGKSLIELLANIGYDLHIRKEKYYHSLFLLAARLSGYEVESEVHTDKGRIDAMLKKEKAVIVVEIKYGQEKSIKDLLQKGIVQIREKKYYEKYVNKDKEVILLAIAFGEDKEIGCRFESI